MLATRTDAATTAIQVREVAEMMASGQWQIGVTENALAQRWGLSVAAIRDRAKEARRLVAHAFGDLEELRGLILAQLEGIAGECRHKEPRTAVSALMAIASIAGLVVTKHVDTREQRPTAKLSPTERLAEIDRIRAQLDEADAHARAELGTVDAVGEDDAAT